MTALRRDIDHPPSIGISRTAWRFLAALFASASVCAPAAAASFPILASSGAVSLAGDFLIVGILAGSILFTTATAYMFLRAAGKARRAELRSAQENAALRQQLDVTQSVMMAEPQALIIFEGDDAPRLVSHSLDGEAGAPKKLRNLLRFASWLERAAALDIERRLALLKRNGEPFTVMVKTLAGAHIEAEGRASGSWLLLKFRDLAGRRLELANLIAQSRTLAEELAAKKTLFDALPIPVWFRGPDGKLQWVNRAYLTAVEAVRLDEVLAQQSELLESQQRRAVETVLANGETFRKRLYTIVAGERRTFDAIVAPIGRSSAGAAIDVAPLESAKGQLDLQIATQARTLDYVSTAVAIFGLGQRLVFYNRAYRDFWRLESQWLDGKPTLGEILDHLRQTRQLPEQADFRSWRAAQLRAHDVKASEIKANEKVETTEGWWHLPDGRTVHVTTDLRPDGGITYLYDDVTQMLALESRYNALIKAQRETLDNLREGVAVFASDGRLKLFNPAFASIWRLTERFLEERPHVDEVIAQCRAFQSGGEPWETTREAVTGVYDKRHSFDGQTELSDGSAIAYAGVPLPDGGTLLTYIDITDSKRAERALVERNEALEAADRLKNAFLSHVSYELRTPLTNIIGFAELLASPHTGHLAPKQAEYLDDIRASSMTLLAIINDILDLAVIDAGRLELKLAPVNVRDVIDAAELGVRERLNQSGLRLETQTAPDVGIMYADGQRVTQVLYNLLSNAISFSTDGSTITLACKREGDMLSFCVQDTGCGIPEEYQDAVFERFESRGQGAARRGAGLGLSIVKSLVELHGGVVSLRSSPGAGTTITILLPEHASRRTPERVAASARTVAAQANEPNEDGAANPAGEPTNNPGSEESGPNASPPTTNSRPPSNISAIFT
jgi:signal transduction histidine kinase